MNISQKLRLVGIGASNLIDEKRPVQLGLFDRADLNEENWEKVDRTLDAIAERFGKETVGRATLKET
jgi:hypothetical protein